MRCHSQHISMVALCAAFGLGLGCAHQPGRAPAQAELQESAWFNAQSQRVMGFIEYSLTDGLERSAAFAVVKEPGGFGMVHLRRGVGNEAKEEAVDGWRGAPVPGLLLQGEDLRILRQLSDANSGAPRFVVAVVGQDPDEMRIDVAVLGVEPEEIFARELVRLSTAHAALFGPSVIAGVSVQDNSVKIIDAINYLHLSDQKSATAKALVLGYRERVANTASAWLFGEQQNLSLREFAARSMEDGGVDEKGVRQEARLTWAQPVDMVRLRLGCANDASAQYSRLQVALAPQGKRSTHELWPITCAPPGKKDGDATWPRWLTACSEQRRQGEMLLVFNEPAEFLRWEIRNVEGSPAATPCTLQTVGYRLGEFENSLTQ